MPEKRTPNDRWPSMHEVVAKMLPDLSVKVNVPGIQVLLEIAMRSRSNAEHRKELLFAIGLVESRFTEKIGKNFPGFFDKDIKNILEFCQRVRKSMTEQEKSEQEQVDTERKTPFRCSSDGEVISGKPPDR